VCSRPSLDISRRIAGKPSRLVDSAAEDKPAEAQSKDA
jgi:hypothetical protein